MRKFDKHTVKRLVGFLFVGLYFFVAMLNTSLLQSYIGACAGRYFSDEWGGKVRIGALHFSPVSHLLLDDIELISPDGDTLFVGEHIGCRFRRFPFHGSSLKLDRVRIVDATYHFASIRGEDGRKHTNLQYIIDYFHTDKPADTTAHPPFTVEVDELLLRRVNYHQDLPEPRHPRHYEHGVSIPHMRYDGISGRFRKVFVMGDSVTCRVVSLTTTEASGLHVVDLSMDVVVSPHIIQAKNLDLETDDSRLLCDALLRYDGWESMSDYCNNVDMDLVLKEGSDVNLCEAAYWAPSLWGINCVVSPRGHCYGPVADLHAENFFAAFGRDSYLMLDGRITGLPDIKRTTIQARVDKLHTTYADLAAVQHPEGVTMKASRLIEQLGVMDVELMLDGGLEDCKTQFAVNTILGNLDGRAAMQYDSLQHDIFYVGEINSPSFGIRQLLPNEWVSHTGFHLTFQGAGADLASLEASLEGRLYDTRFRGHALERTSISASFGHNKLLADVLLDDSLVGCDLAASADFVEHAYTLDASLQHLHLSDLWLAETDSDLVVSTRLRADLQGETLESLAGTLSASDVYCTFGSRTLALRDINITSRITEGVKNLALQTSWMSLAMRGYFQYADLPLAARDFCSHYLPAYYNPFLGDTAVVSPQLAASIDFNLVWDDAHGVFAQAFPRIRVAQGTSLHANYNAAEHLKLVFRSDSLAYGNIVLNDVGCNSQSAGVGYQLLMKAGDISVGTMPLVENFRLDAGLGPRTTTLALQWDDDAATVNNQGDLEFFLTSTADDNKIIITRPTLYVLGQEWNIVCPDGVLANNDRLRVENLKIYGLDQSMVLKADLAHSDDDIVKLAFDDFSLDRICELLLADKKLSLQGSLDGQFNIRGMGSTPYYDANLVIDSCVVNGQLLGRVDARSNWEASENKLYIDLVSQRGETSHHDRPVELHGSMTMLKGISNMDFYADLDNVSLQTAGTVISSFSSNISGSVGGSLHFYGTPAAPKLDGSLMISDGLLQVDATGVTYYFSDELRISNDTLFLRDFAIHDARGDYALANGLIAYAGDDLQLDIGLQSSRLLVLDNRPVGDGFYGTILASLQGAVSGTASHPAIRATAATLDGSTLGVPINNNKQMAESDFVHFVSDKPRPVAPVRRASSGSTLDLQVDATITPGLALQLPMGFSGMSVNVAAAGHGDIHLVKRGAAPLSVLGDYEFASGNFNFSIPLLSFDFAIQQGSSLNFPGALDDARFDISAAYSQRVNIAGLLGTSGEVGADAYVQVQNVIHLAGTMQAPRLGFDIQLPNVEQSVSDQVFAYIDRTNEREMLNQTVSLLLLGRFATENAVETESGLITAGSSFNVISSSLSSIVSNMVKVVDVNFKYQAGTVANTGQFDVGISKEWKKFYFESTFGYGNTNSGEAEAGQTNVLVGDVVAGYRVTPYFHFYGFHRDNNSYYTRTELPYKQGVGVKLTKSFNTLGDLFPWLRRKKSAANP